MDDDQQFCLRWNNHQSTLISVFDTLLEKGIHVDCTLAAEGQTLKAHKVVLSACSPYFESVLSQQYDKHPIIILKDVKFAELRAMMDYMYRGEVNISQDQLAALLKAAESLQIKGLSDSKPPPRPSSPSHKVRLLDSSGSGNVSNREGSSSPLPRKRRKPRRNSLNETLESEMPNNTDNIPSQNHIVNNTAALITKPPTTEPTIENDNNVNKLKVNDGIDCTPKIKSDISADGIDTKVETCEEGTEDSVEDLTLDEEIESESEQTGPGPSHPQGDCVQSFSWHMDRAQDESTPSLDGQRDPQVPTKYDELLAGIFNRTVPLTRALLRSGSKVEKPILQKITRKRRITLLSKTVSTKSQSVISKKDAAAIKLDNVKDEIVKNKDKFNASSKSTNNDTKTSDKTGATNETKVTDKARATSKTKVADKASATNETKDTDKAGATSRTKVADKASATIETKVVENAGATNETKVADKASETKVAEKTHAIKGKSTSPYSSNEDNKHISPNLPCAQYATPNGYKCPNCQRSYNARKNLVRHVNLECGREPQHKCLHCTHKTHRRNELKRHIIKKHTTNDPAISLTGFKLDVQ